MALKTSEAFILDTRRIGEADQIVALFTQSDGKVRSVAKSAAKSRRRFGGRLERLSRVRATWFEKEGRELSRLDGCDLLAESFTLHQDFGVGAVLGHVAEIADTFAPEHEADPGYFRLLGAVLDAFRSLPPGASPLPLARYFEYWTLRLHGLMPEEDLPLSRPALAQLERMRLAHPTKLQWTAAPAAAAEIESFLIGQLTGFLGHALRAHRFLVDQKLTAL